MRHVAPRWMYEFLDRQELKDFDELYEKMGVTREEFWKEFWREKYTTLDEFFKDVVEKKVEEEVEKLGLEKDVEERVYEKLEDREIKRVDEVDKVVRDVVKEVEKEMRDELLAKYETAIERVVGDNVVAWVRRSDGVVQKYTMSVERLAVYRVAPKSGYLWRVRR